MAFPIFVIALIDHQESQRMLKDCLDSAKKFNYQPTVWPAVDGRTVSKRSWEELNILPRFEKISMDKPGVQGCFISHWQLWNKCVELNCPIIILEHDSVITQSINVLPKGDLLKLHKLIKAKEHWGCPDSEAGTWTVSAHAYLITPVGAKKLLDFVKSNGAIPADVIIGDKVLNYNHLDYDLIERNINRISTTQKL
jgi:GR25 family glycosyltransferase involved in LPS biosynthesis